MEAAVVLRAELPVAARHQMVALFRYGPTLLALYPVTVAVPKMTFHVSPQADSPLLHNPKTTRIPVTHNIKNKADSVPPKLLSAYFYTGSFEF